ncbi:hypothetical protein [Streptomyces erythrochromogenes]|uniref:hypothetical protein n=1 Tax=Streptomyces erythrochromogenes TaxID=285574 RepID=UPI0037D1A767
MQNAQGKGQTWFPGKRVATVDVRYYLEWTDRPGQYIDRLSEREAGAKIRQLRASEELSALFTVVREVREGTAKACSRCGARPRTWEWDCDGKFENATCDSEQCRATRP